MKKKIWVRFFRYERVSDLNYFVDFFYKEVSFKFDGNFVVIAIDPLGKEHEIGVFKERYDAIKFLRSIYHLVKDPEQDEHTQI